MNKKTIINQCYTHFVKFDISDHENFVKILSSDKRISSKGFDLKFIYKIYNTTFDDVCNYVNANTIYIPLALSDKTERISIGRRSQKKCFESFCNGELQSFDDKPSVINYEDGRIIREIYHKNNLKSRDNDKPAHIDYVLDKTKENVFNQPQLVSLNCHYFIGGLQYKFEEWLMPNNLLRQRGFYGSIRPGLLHSDSGPALITLGAHNQYSKYYYYHGEYIGVDLNIPDEKFKEYMQNREIMK